MTRELPSAIGNRCHVIGSGRERVVVPGNDARDATAKASTITLGGIKYHARNCRFDVVNGRQHQVIARPAPVSAAAAAEESSATTTTRTLVDASWVISWTDGVDTGGYDGLVSGFEGEALRYQDFPQEEPTWITPTSIPAPTGISGRFSVQGDGGATEDDYFEFIAWGTDGPTSDGYYVETTGGIEYTYRNLTAWRIQTS